MAENAPQGRRFVWQRLDVIELAILDLKKAVELMAQQTIVRQNEFDQIKYQVGSLAEAQAELEKRVEILEKHTSTQSWIFRQIGTILLVVLAAYLASIWL